MSFLFALPWFKNCALWKMCCRILFYKNLCKTYNKNGPKILISHKTRFRRIRSCDKVWPSSLIFPFLVPDLNLTGYHLMISNDSFRQLRNKKEQVNIGEMPQSRHGVVTVHKLDLDVFTEPENKELNR